MKKRFAARGLAASFGLALAAALSSCGSSLVHVEVLLGNASFGNGDFDGAIASYLRAAEMGADPAWIKYDLGTAYLAAGEAEEAAAILAANSQAAPPGSGRAAYLSAFNAGCALLALERNEEAWAAFKRALQLESGSLQAKRNLEIAARLMEREEEEGGAPAVDPIGDPIRDEADRALDFARKKERDKWEGRESPVPIGGVDDW